MAESVRVRPASSARSGRARWHVAPLLVNATLLAGSAVMLLPFIWMILSSFKTQYEILSTPPTFFPLPGTPRTT